MLLAGLLLLSCTSVLAQAPAEVRVGVGYGTYTMRDLKEVQQMTLNELGADAKAIEQYPSSFNYSLRYFLKSPVQDHLGVVLETGATKGSMIYKYNGNTYREQLHLRYNRLGAVMESYHSLGKGFSSWFGIELSVLYSKLMLEIQGAEPYKFKSWGGAVQPYVSLERKIKGVNVGAQLGVCLSSSETFGLEGFQDAKLINNQTKEELGPGWLGLRTTLYLGIPFKSKNNAPEEEW